MANLNSTIKKEIQDIKDGGLYKDERIIESPQNASILVNQKKVLNFCSTSTFLS